MPAAKTPHTSQLYEGTSSTVYAIQTDVNIAGIVGSGAEVIAIGSRNTLDIQLANSSSGKGCVLTVTEFSHASPTAANMTNQQQITIPTTDLATPGDVTAFGQESSAAAYLKAVRSVRVRPSAYVVLTLASSTGGTFYGRYWIRENDGPFEVRPEDFEPGAPHACVVVAGSDAPAKVLESADYVCDGTADEVQINAAIDEVAGWSCAGGTVKLVGTFTCAASVVPKKQIRITGDTVYGTTITLANGANCDVMAPSGSSGDSFLVLEHFDIAGNKANQTSGHGIDFTGVDMYDVRIDDVTIMSCKECGIKTDQCWSWHINSLVVEYCDSHGFHLTNDSSGAGGQMVNCKFLLNGGHGLYCQATTSWFVVNCELGSSDYTTPSYGAKFDAGTLVLLGGRVSFVDDQAGNYSGGLSLMSVNSKIDSVTFTSGAAGARATNMIDVVAGGYRNSIVNCHFDDSQSGAAAITVNAHATQVRGNTFRSCDSCIGLSIYSYSQIEGNIFHACTTGITFSTGTRHRITDNTFYTVTTPFSGTVPDATMVGDNICADPFVQVQGAAAGIDSQYVNNVVKIDLTLTGANDFDLADGSDRSASKKMADLADGHYMLLAAHIEGTSTTANLSNSYNLAIGTIPTQDAASADLTAEDDIITSAAITAGATQAITQTNTTAALLDVSSAGLYISVGATNANITGACTIAITAVLSIWLKKMD